MCYHVGMPPEVRPLKVLISGDRDWLDFEPIHKYVMSLPKNTILIEGGAPGADTLAKEAGLMREWELVTLMQNVHYRWTKSEIVFTSDAWKSQFLLVMKYGAATIDMPALWTYPQHRSGGPIRNSAMLKLCEPDRVVGFHNNLQRSKGTKDMLAKSVSKGIATYIYSDTHGLRPIFKGDTRLRKEVK